MDETETQVEPVIVENNTTIIAPETEQQPDEPDFSEDALREFDAWCANIEQQIAAIETSLIELRSIIGEHNHDGYAASEHEHTGLASEEHTHEGYALSEHEHASRTRSEDRPPKETHPWFRKVGE